MTDQIEVASFRVLEEFEVAIHRFSTRVLGTLEDVEQQFKRKQEFVDQIIADRMRSVSYWRAEYDAADPEEDDISTISHRLEQAEDDLQEAKRWRRKVEDAYGSYSKKAAEGVFLCTDHIAKARAVLRQKVKDLYEYAALQPDSETPGAGTSTRVISAVLTAQQNRDQIHEENYQEFMAQFSARNIEFKALGQRFVNDGDIMALRGGDDHWNEGQGKFWNHHGNSADFYDSMARTYPQLREQMAKGHSIEELKLDPKSRVAAEFWWSNSDQVKLTKFKETYFVDEGGFHRVALAKKNGLGDIPCFVTEATLKNEQR